MEQRNFVLLVVPAVLMVALVALAALDAGHLHQTLLAVIPALVNPHS